MDPGRNEMVGEVKIVSGMVNNTAVCHATGSVLGMFGFYAC